MPLGTMHVLEEMWSNAYDARIDHLCRIGGLEFRVYKRGEKGEFDRVWGVGAGVESDSKTTIIGVLVSYDLVAVDDVSISNFTGGYFFTPSNRTIAVGDEIEIVRERQTNLSSRYKITKDMQAGMTRRAFQRWEVSSIGE